MIAVLGDPLGFYGGRFAAVLVGQDGMNKWWMVSAGFEAKKTLRLEVGSRLTFFLVHTVHFISVFPFWAQV